MLMIEICKITDSIAPPIMNSLFLFRGNVQNIQSFQNVLEIVSYRSLFLKANLPQDSEAVEVFCRKGAIKNFEKFAGKYLRQILFFKKEALAQVFSCEFCEISKKTFFCRTPLVTVSEDYISQTSLHASK